MNKYVISEYVTAADIKKIRKQLGVTQKEFATIVGSSTSTIERWERSEDIIQGPITLLIRMLERYPEYLEQMRIPEQNFSIRMWYMYKNEKCTLIDVDECHQVVQIKNYTDKVMFQAFGTNLSPTFSDYQEFLESRCFPRSRDKLKLVLENLDLPFYDPFLIIKKTDGRMAEDDFWIKIEQKGCKK